MKVIEYGEKLNEKVCLALGYFDGVHRGHRLLLEKTRDLAKEYDALSVVSTFSDRPHKSDYLTTFKDRKDLFAEQSMDICMSILYIKERHKTGREFFKELVSNYDIKAIVCGEDYKFGCDHLCTSDLKTLCDEFGILLSVEALLVHNTLKISSSGIKRLLKSGKLETANKLLATPFHISGKVVRGQGIGLRINMPTMNIDRPIDVIHIKEGVYGTKVLLNGKLHDAVTNYGSRPTFERKTFAVESHLIDYEIENQLGNEIKVYFIKYLRSIRKFKSSDELVSQVSKDKGWIDKC